ncbi:MAG: ribosome silencing factor [Fimbriimonas ginsengisoli]|uniref:Ribosomal silencing factor RsfS n=1 Tax=Fimbriimonas ginsengisoli TaxID=1005039 RepID=A0A931LYE6_FIMGI|nr:ribosome silencing factor [Fimbriimonas ginsengisoli]MBI3721154.1 ribosome silencing factor [Fimbriimonas ginsengisoli]
MTSKKKAEAIIAAADELKAENIETLDVRAKTSVADYFIVCTGTSDRHVSSVADRVAEKMAEQGEKPTRVEGERSGWVLQDYGDVILHVMREEQRQFYDMEALWKAVRPDPDLR